MRHLKFDSRFSDIEHVKHRFAKMTAILFQFSIKSQFFFSLQISDGGMELLMTKQLKLLQSERITRKINAVTFYHPISKTNKFAHFKRKGTVDKKNPSVNWKQSWIKLVSRGKNSHWCCGCCKNACLSKFHCTETRRSELVLHVR